MAQDGWMAVDEPVLSQVAGEEGGCEKERLEGGEEEEVRKGEEGRRER